MDDRFHAPVIDFPGGQEKVEAAKGFLQVPAP